MNRTLVGVAVIASHPENSLGNLDHRGGVGGNGIAYQPRLHHQYQEAEQGVAEPGKGA